MIDCIGICMILALMIALFDILCKAFPPSIGAKHRCVAWVEPDISGSACREWNVLVEVA